jgi:hypothetical protein
MKNEEFKTIIKAIRLKKRKWLKVAVTRKRVKKWMASKKTCREEKEYEKMESQ